MGFGAPSSVSAHVDGSGPLGVVAPSTFAVAVIYAILSPSVWSIVLSALIGSITLALWLGPRLRHISETTTYPVSDQENDQ